MTEFTSSAGLSARRALEQLINGFRISALVAAVAELRVADALACGPMSGPHLARSCGAHPEALERAMRALVSEGLFAFDGDKFRLNELGELLRSDAEYSLRFTAMSLTQPASWRSYESAVHAIRTGQPAAQIVFGEDVFSHRSRHSRELEIFNGCMTEQGAWHMAEIITSMDLGGTTRVVDVGGGLGALIAAILRRHTEISGVLFELPDVIARSRSVLEAAGVAERCELAAGSFFRDRIPARGDLYLLKRVLHDWDDLEAASILRNVRRSVSADARLVIVEQVLGENNPASYRADIAMMLITGGRERTAEQYGSLLTAAGFRLSSVIPTASPFCLIEATPVGN